MCWRKRARPTSAWRTRTTSSRSTEESYFLKQIADISRSRYEAGTESAANVLVAETDHSKMLETRRDLERALSDAQSQLNTLMNRDAFAPIGVPVGAPMTAR